MRIQTLSFEGHDGVRLQDGATSLVVTTSVGPRILGLLGRAGNVLAVLPDAVLPRPNGGPYRLIGGHRLWAAPEVPAVTYEPDDRPCAVAEVDGGVRVEASPDGAGMVKAVEVRPDDGGWIVDHVLTNRSGSTVHIAPWAVTQLRLGGQAVLPLGGGDTGPQANRSLVLWPYTDPGDERVRFGPGEVRIDARATGPILKFGAAPSAGRVSYRIAGEVFEKRVELDALATYPDRGAAVQVYLCDDFCELETLGPLRDVEPGESATHRERWRLVPE